MSRSSLLLAGTLAASLLSTAAFAADVITIGIPVGLSGANSVVAPSVVQSAELAVEEINAKGGILGKQVKLEVADDASGAAGAQKAFDLADLPEEGRCADLDGNQRRAQCRPADRQSRQDPLHLHVLL